MKLLENPHQEIERAAYSSWLGFLPLAVFLGSKSEENLLAWIVTGDTLNEWTYSGEYWAEHHLGQW